MKNLIKETHELCEEDWNRLKPLFQEKLGRYWRTHQEKDRVILDGVLWKHTTNVQWRNLPKKYGKWYTVYRRFKRWRDLGLWEEILHALYNKNTPDQS